MNSPQLLLSSFLSVRLVNQLRTTATYKFSHRSKSSASCLTSPDQHLRFTSKTIIHTASLSHYHESSNFQGCHGQKLYKNVQDALELSSYIDEFEGRLQDQRSVSAHCFLVSSSLWEVAISELFVKEFGVILFQGL